MNVKEMMSVLKAEKILTWFDLGLFIDRFKENRKTPSTKFNGSYNDFKKFLGESEIAIVTFIYSIDGATMESEKYAKVFRLIFKDLKLHYIAGQFHEKGELFLLPDAKRFQIDELASFNNWKLYNDFFFKKLERGSKVYNKLILRFWAEVLVITEKLAKYIDVNNIKMFVTNFGSIANDKSNGNYGFYFRWGDSVF